MPKAIILCGVPTSGKSTWTKNNPGYNIISSDDIIENYAKATELSYNEVFDTYINTAILIMVERLDYCTKNNQNVICDQTHLNVKSRKRKLRLIPDHYEKIAVYFEINKDEMFRRNKNKDRTKTIPRRVLTQMYDSYSRPSVNEGFSAIYDGQIFNCPLKETFSV
jgi:predicted kinase